MSEHIRRDRLDVLRNDIAPALQHRVRSCGHRKIDRGARGSAVPDPLPDVNVCLGRIARGLDQVDDILLDLRIHVDCVGKLSQAHHILGRQHGRDLVLHCRASHSTQDLQLVLALRVIHSELEHEAIHLSFGQGIGALLLDRVLRGQNQERILERVALGAYRYLAFLHGLQQGALHLRRRAVDLVGQHDVCEDRALLGAETAVARRVDHGAD